MIRNTLPMIAKVATGSVEEIRELKIRGSNMFSFDIPSITSKIQFISIFQYNKRQREKNER